MNVRKGLGVTVIAAMLMSSAGAMSAPKSPGKNAAAKSDADVIREARDRDEIEHLAWRYARALDSFNAEAYASTYTPDGAFGQTKGHDALFKMIDAFNHPAPPPAGSTAPARTGPPGLLHMETNHWIEFTGKDRALFHYYWITIGKPAKQGDPTTLLAAGNGIDEVVRQGGQWLFKSRQVVAPDDK